MPRMLTLVLTLALVAGATALAASQGHGPTVSRAGRHHRAPCRHSHRRGCWIEVSSYQWGASDNIGSPTHGASGREAGLPSSGEIGRPKPKHKGR